MDSKIIILKDAMKRNYPIIYAGNHPGTQTTVEKLLKTLNELCLWYRNFVWVHLRRTSLGCDIESVQKC